MGLLMPDPGMKHVCPQITGSCGNLQASPGKGRASVAKLTAEPGATRSTCVLQADPKEQEEGGKSCPLSPPKLTNQIIYFSSPQLK